MALTPSWPGPTGLTTTTDGRKAVAGLIVKDTAGVARSGVFPAHANPLVTARADMNVDIAPFTAAGVQFGGPVLFSNDGTTQLPSVLVAPVSGSNYYVLYAKQNESTAPGTDANNNRVLGRALSAVSFAAARAALPEGAVELATVQVPAGTTQTNSGAIITATHQFTATAGGIVWARDATELGAWTPTDGNFAYRIDTGILYRRDSGGWVADRNMQITGGKNGAAPVGANIIEKVHYVAGLTTASSTLAFTFPTAFPTSCAAIFFTTAMGTASPAVLNANTLSATGATVAFASTPTTNVGFYFYAIGW